MEFPEDLRYTEQHEWARREEHGIRVGITDFAQDALGDVVYVDVPQVGTTVRTGESFGEVESTKSVSDVYAPVGGTVIASNEALVDSPQLLNEDPYGRGWMILVEPEDPTTLDRLLDAGGYQAFVSKESSQG